MNAEQLDRTVSIAANLAYVLVVGSLLVVMFPGLRKPIGRAASRVAFDWRYGLWLGDRPQTPTPAWAIELLTRASAPTAIEPEPAE